MASKQSAVVTLKKQRYYIQRTKATLPPQDVEHLHKFKSSFVPVTAVSWDKPTFTDDNLRYLCRKYDVFDDVWCIDFLSVIILLLPTDLHVEVQNKRVLCFDNHRAQLPKGPLMVEKSTGHIYKVSKLVPDTHFAFISAIVPDSKPKASFSEIPHRNEIEIALPSRLYFEKTDAKPLAGVRIAVKDTIALKGLRTGYGSAAWAETYEPELYTAPCVQQLIDAGAIIVGKAKSSEFAEGIDPADWCEGICPFNPRGDGQQKPSSSSTGSASAVAAYKWLDISYGTDTGGSIRHPAGVQGLFGQRPTQGAIDLTGVLGATPLFNTVGIFARKSKMFTRVGRYLVDPTSKMNSRMTGRKYNLLYPTRAPLANNRDPFHNNQLRWFPHQEIPLAEYSMAEKQIETVMSRIESVLHCTRQPFNLDHLWRATHPIGQPRSIDEATGSIYGVITTASAYEAAIDQFVLDYAAKNGGRQPPMSPLVKKRFTYGRQCSKEQISTALEATQAFSQWVLNDLFGSLDQDATTLLIFPQSWGRPDYRSVDESEVAEVKPAALFKEYFSIYSFAYLCGCPDYTIPIGEVPYHSSVTNQIEYLPVSISLLGRPGTDLELFDIVDHLHEKGVISDVMAGARMYADSVSKFGMNEKAA